MQKSLHIKIILSCFKLVTADIQLQKLDDRGSGLCLNDKKKREANFLIGLNFKKENKI